MNHCTECEAIEGPTIENEDGEIECGECGTFGSIEMLDEDYGKER